jgi:opacity protein-like surface antigen
MNYLLKLSTFIVFSIVSGFASADMYAVVDVGQGTAANYCPSQAAGVTCSNSTSITQFGLGYQFTKYVALEANYLSSGDLSSSSCTTTICANGGGSTDTKSNLSGIKLSVALSVPVNDTFSFIGKLGLLSSTVVSSDTLAGNSFSTSTSYANSTVSYGIGALINLNDRFALRVLYEDMGSVKASSAGTGSNLTAVSGGVVVNF